MEKNTVLLQDTEAFMHGELDNVTVQQNCIVLDLVQGGYVPYGCYTSAPIPMPLFDALFIDPFVVTNSGRVPGPRVCAIVTLPSAFVWSRFFIVSLPPIASSMRFSLALPIEGPVRT